MRIYLAGLAFSYLAANENKKNLRYLEQPQLAYTPKKNKITYFQNSF